jgi:hypothetical protein
MLNLPIALTRTQMLNLAFSWLLKKLTWFSCNGSSNKAIRSLKVETIDDWSWHWKKKHLQLECVPASSQEFLCKYNLHRFFDPKKHLFIWPQIACPSYIKIIFNFIYFLIGFSALFFLLIFENGFFAQLITE